MRVKHKYNVIDLFSGIGGFSKGFENEGFDIKLGIDNWPIALKTFKTNHKNTEILLEDLTKIKKNYYEDLPYKVDIIIAGPPCQGFSMAGKRQEDDIRNRLFNEVVRAAKYTKAPIVIIENVVGLVSMKDIDGNSVKDRIIHSLKEVGYDVDYKILTASDYGVPQNRRRVVFVAHKNNKAFSFPKESVKKVTVGEALGNLPDVESKKYTKPENNFQQYLESSSKKIYNHTKMNHSKAVSDRIALVPEGGNWRDIPPEHYRVGGTHSNNYRRLDRSKPSITIKHATKSMIIHPVYDRVITAREAARLQSFQDDFFIEGSSFEQHQQLANAVPPLLGAAIAKAVREYIDNE